MDLIDLTEEPIEQSQSGTRRLEASFAGDVAAGQRAGLDAVTADSNSQSDPFGGFESLLPQTGSSTVQKGLLQSHEAGTMQQEHQELPHSPAQHKQQAQDPDSSSAACLKAAAERAARTSDVLQQHSMEQGESNAKLRYVAVISAALWCWGCWSTCQGILGQVPNAHCSTAPQLQLQHRSPFAHIPSGWLHVCPQRQPSMYCKQPHCSRGITSTKVLLCCQSSAKLKSGLPPCSIQLYAHYQTPHHTFQQQLPYALNQNQGIELP